MPNWCEGNLRIRGTKENIKKFLENEIVYYANNTDNEHKPVIEEDEYCMSLIQYTGLESFYIRNTFRNFFFTNRIDIGWPDADPEEEIVVVIDNFNSAWALRKDGWAEHAMKYNIDFRMFGFERGMEFSQVMTVLRDGTVEQETKQYDDWNWECPFPELGG